MYLQIITLAILLRLYLYKCKPNCQIMIKIIFGVMQKMDHTDTEIFSYLGIEYVIVRIFSLLICCANEYQVNKNLASVNKDSTQVYKS